MAEITGTSGNDNGIDNPILEGTDGDDVISGAEGDDILRGLGGNDVLSGGTGQSTVEGGDGDDRILHGVQFAVADTSRTDVLDGGDGFDWLVLDAEALGAFNANLRDMTIRNIEAIDLSGKHAAFGDNQLDNIQHISGFGESATLQYFGSADLSLGHIQVVRPIAAPPEFIPLRIQPRHMT
ncbi:calcium-binding protein [Pseudoprimorskyibacter insulae]|uniref:Hemolysin, chromosomal n=1 Tax=Pseudoprimorskyibacter insulae TaxID=1695997 RepID=A0A2R8B171_9RHOB|nr:hypothetical protein [Pseudoprimorskyibacter insulae]SPF81859.1 Hemolysin, chromosomal [Pseudoprimorskyibacter insulae]